MSRLLLIAILALIAFALGSGGQAAERPEPDLAIAEDRTKYRLGWLKRGRLLRKVTSEMTRFRRGYLKQRRLHMAHHRSSEDPARGMNYWIGRQIYAANVIGRQSGGDPWPNCPDPFDGGGYSWYDTVRCENGGNWYDSPGYYRCGLQFDPMWERRFGRLCP